MSAVFISYSRHDLAFVRRLHAALDALSRNAWVDWQGIAPTAEWMAEIRRGIDGADALLFVISPSWLASDVCAQELEHAVQQGKRLVPVVCLDAPAAQVPAALAKLNWIFPRFAASAVCRASMSPSRRPTTSGRLQRLPAAFRAPQFAVSACSRLGLL